MISVVVAMFLATLVLLEVGRRIGARFRAEDAASSKAAAAPIEGAVLGLMGLLIAFTFYGAASRFDVLRQMTVVEANDIGTAWLRLDLLSGGCAAPATR